MASATLEVEKVVTGSVVLEMSLEEARTLRTILGNVGGHPDTTPRGYCDGMFNALCAAGITPFNGDDILEPQRNAIYFAKDSLKRIVN